MDIFRNPFMADRRRSERKEIENVEEEQCRLEGYDYEDALEAVFKPTEEDVADMSERIKNINEEMNANMMSPFPIYGYEGPFEVGKAYAIQLGGGTEYGRVSAIYDDFIELKEMVIVRSGPDIAVIVERGFINSSIERIDASKSTLFGIGSISRAWPLHWWDEQKDKTDVTEESETKEDGIDVDDEHQRRDDPKSEEDDGRDG
jgi:hypothetical protein